MKRWKFCKANDCWWLVINDLEQFLEYKDKTNSKYGYALIHGIYEDEKSDKYKTLYEAAVARAKANQVSLVQGMSDLCYKMLTTQLDYILSGEELWFNELGGYNFGMPNIEATVYRDKLLFPDYTKKDIRVSRWGNNGQHYYAKVGEIEVKETVDGEVIMKWNTYDEAYNKALAYCTTDE